MAKYPETHIFEYKGNNFRSKLIAKWAVFFDEMGISYEYEPDCFVLSETLKFIPTFKIRLYIPNQDSYSTYYVKVVRDLLTEYQFKQVTQFTSQTKEEVMVLEGPPDLVNYHVYFPLEDGTVTSTAFVFDDYKYGVFLSGDNDMLAPDDSLEPSQTKIEALRLSRSLSFNFNNKKVHNCYVKDIAD